MKVTIRQLNEFGNILQARGLKKMATDIHHEVQRMLSVGAQEVNLPENTDKEKRLVWLIQNAGTALGLKIANQRR